MKSVTDIRDLEDRYHSPEALTAMNLAPLAGPELPPSLRERRIRRVCSAAIEICRARVRTVPEFGTFRWLLGRATKHVCMDCGAAWACGAQAAHKPGCVIASTLRYAQEILATPSSPQTTDERSAAAAAEPTDDRGRTGGDSSGTRTLFVNAEAVAAAWDEAQRGDRPNRETVLAPAPDLGEPYAYDRERGAVVDRHGLVVADLHHTDLEAGTHEAVGTRLARAVNFCAQLGPELRIEDYLSREVRA